MDAQSVIAVICVALALVFLGRELWRTWHPAKDGCGGCGCASRKTSLDGSDHARLELPMEPSAHRKQ
jgi:hypothetical protein